MNQTSKELVLKTINEKKTGKLPIDYMPSKLTDEKIRSSLNISYDLKGERELLNYLGADVYYLSARDISQNEGFHTCWKKKPIITQKDRACSLGIKWKRGAYNSKFSVDESIGSPLHGVTNPKDIIAYPWPKKEDFDFSPLLDEAEMHADRAIVGGLWTGILGDAYRMLGFQDFLLYSALYPDVIHTLIDTLTDVYLELNDTYFQTMKNNMDIWFFGNDFGSQNGLLMSREMWLDFYYEPIRKLIQLASSYNLHVMMHSCGSIEPLLNDLIELGVEIIDPVQITASGMDPPFLAEKYQNLLTFHGGIDTQQILPFKKPEEVSEHCTYIVDTFSDKTGYIASGSQILDNDIPLENIIAMYTTLKAIKEKKTD